ncbi:MAG: hypothetical protein AABY01_04135, partial [Nanoarchaeota archaeon]
MPEIDINQLDSGELLQGIFFGVKPQEYAGSGWSKFEKRTLEKAVEHAAKKIPVLEKLLGPYVIRTTERGGSKDKR